MEKSLDPENPTSQPSPDSSAASSSEYLPATMVKLIGPDQGSPFNVTKHLISPGYVGVHPVAGSTSNTNRNVSPSVVRILTALFLFLIPRLKEAAAGFSFIPYFLLKNVKNLIL